MGLGFQTKVARATRSRRTRTNTAVNRRLGSAGRRLKSDPQFRDSRRAASPVTLDELTAIPAGEKLTVQIDV